MYNGMGFPMNIHHDHAYPTINHYDISTVAYNIHQYPSISINILT